MNVAPNKCSVRSMLRGAFQKNSNLNACAPAFQPFITDSHKSLDDQNPGNLTQRGESNLDPNDDSAYSKLKCLRVKHFNRIIIAHLNINSIRNKFVMVSDLVKGNIDVLFVSETKIDSSFPTSQFITPGFSPPFRLDCSKGIFCYMLGRISQ